MTDPPIHVRILRESRREARQRRKSEAFEAERQRWPRTVEDGRGNSYTVYPDGKRYYLPRR